jgi:hypothetical protein
MNLRPLRTGARAVPGADALAGRLAAGRVVLASAFLAAPVPGLRALGVDTATAQRVAWLTRMMAVRDAALGAGAGVARRRGADPRPWLVAGAVSDAVDALVVAAAIKQGRLRGAGPALLVSGGAVAAGVGLATAARLGRS